MDLKDIVREMLKATTAHSSGTFIQGLGKEYNKDEDVANGEKFKNNAEAHLLMMLEAFKQDILDEAKAATEAAIRSRM